jgi:hypothetical protein
MRISMNHILPVLIGLAILIPQAKAQAPAQMSFATPEDAAKALLQAFQDQDLEKLNGIFGADAVQAISSGDPVSDRHDREVMAIAMAGSWRWAPLGATRKELIIGDEEWPFPVPLTKAGNAWRFDTEAGKHEVLARRIGRNELAVIDLCLAYVALQKEYAADGHDGKPAGLYAQKIRSTAGKQDGLYWEAKPGAPPSPMGDLAADAEAAGYDRAKNPDTPFMGYFFRIVAAQGSAAPGGAKNYLVNGDMSGGFALVAFPAKYGYGGVMTFIVNQNGVVYEKDLGKDTAQAVSEIKAYNPDKTWMKSRVR